MEQPGEGRMFDVIGLKDIWEVSLPVMVLVLAGSASMFILILFMRQHQRARLKEISTENSDYPEQQSLNSTEQDPLSDISKLLRNVDHGPVPERYRYVKLLLSHGMESDEIAKILNISRQEAAQLHALFGICKVNEKKIN
jgi:DNA-binding NarL/FixJ family response regulator